MGRRPRIIMSAAALSAIALASCTGPRVTSQPIQEDEQVVQVVEHTPVPTPTTVPTLSPTPFEPLSFIDLADTNPPACLELIQLKEDAEDLEWCISTFFGQPNLRETMVNRIVPNRAFHVGGVHIDTSTEPNRIYILDSGNNRILGFDSTEMYPDREADIVIGQPSAYDSGTCNGDNTQYLDPTAETLCFQPSPEVISTLESPRSSQMATDSEGNLYVLDLANNRVLKYLNPFETDTVADDVWGQDSFTERACNRGEERPDDNTLCTEWPSRFSNSREMVFAAGVEIDSEGNLWVADAGNHRVLRFPEGEKHADLVLGQEDFTSDYGECRLDAPLDKLCKPIAVKVHPETGELYVLEGEWPGRARIRVFEQPFHHGMETSREIGIGSEDDPVSGLNWPRGFVFDPSGEGDIWVGDGGNSRVVLFDHDGNITKIIGQPDAESTGCLGALGSGYLLPDGKFGLACHPDGEFGVDSEGNLYIVTDYWPRAVVRFNPADIPEPPYDDGDIKANGMLLYYGWNQVSGLTLHNTHGFSVAGSQLVVSDGQRLLIWDDYIEKEPGAHADRVIGPSDFETNLGLNQAGGDLGHFYPRLVGAQSIDLEGRLWLSARDQIYIFQTPFTGSGHTENQDEPVAILESGRSIFWADTDEPVRFNIGGLAYDAENDALWLVDGLRNWILRVSNPLGEHPVVEMVLGQPDTEDRDAVTRGESCNAGEGYGSPQQYGLCSPAFPILDNHGNLYIIDGSFELNGNRRVLEFDAEKLVPDPDNIFPLIKADRVYAKPNFETRRCQGGQPCNPTWVAFDSQNHMVMTVDGYGDHQYQRVFVYLNPLESQEPDYIFPFAFGQAAVAQFDSLDNLVLQDHTWNRILVIEKPFERSEEYKGNVREAAEPR